MRCLNCNHENPDGFRFCENCGQSLNGPLGRPDQTGPSGKPGPEADIGRGQAQPEDAFYSGPVFNQDYSLNSPQKTKKRRKKGRFVLVICLIVIAALILGCFGWFGFDYLKGKKNEGNIYTVSFDINADEAQVSGAPDMQSVEYGNTASCPSYPVRYGYLFGGWYTDDTCTKEYDFSKAVKEDLTLYACWLDPDSEEAQITDEEYEEYIDCLDEIYEIYSGYVSDETGYVDEGDYESVISEVEELVLKYEEDGIIAFYSVEDETIYMEFSSLMVYIFYIPEAGTDSDPTDLSGTVCFPYYGLEWANDDYEEVDDREDEIVQTADAFADLTIQFADVSCIEGFNYAQGAEMFIWHGHGGYSQYLGEQMATSDIISSYPDALSTYIAGTDDTLNEALGNRSIVGVGVGHDSNSAQSVYAITSYYVENYFPEMDDAIVYLAACKSGYTSQLADAFISKGAEVVIANAGSDNIDTEYNQTMINEVFSLMSGQDEGESGYLTVSEALNVLNQRGYGKSFSKTLFITTYHDAYPAIFYADGNADAANYTLYASLEGSISSQTDIDMSDVLVTFENSAEKITWYSIPDEDGSFSFGKLDGGEDNTYTLEVSYNGSVLYTAEMTLKKHRRTDIGNINLDGTEVSVYVTDKSAEDISTALVSFTDSDGNTYSASLGTDDSLNFVFKANLMPGEYTVNVSCDGYESVTDTISVEETALTLRYVLEMTGRVCITQLPITAYDQYDDNEGDSCIFHLDGSGLVNVHGDTVRNGSSGTDGTVYENGLEVWIARWNFTEEMSWASITYDLDGDYTTLTGGTGLIESYNTSDFDTTIYFYDGDTLLASYHMTPSSYSYNISIDVTGVEELTIYASDNEYAKGGTSFALYDMYLEK